MKNFKIFNYNKKSKLKLLTLGLTGIMAISMLSTSCSGKPQNGDIEYETGNHVIAHVDRSISLFFGKSGKTALEAPDGYKIVDYDYDFTDDGLEFDDFVYQNTVPITTNNKDNIGVPRDEFRKDNHEDGVYAPGEHILVSINRNLDLLFGKDATMDLVAPNGYEVMDYDYDKTDAFSFENILYRNIVEIKVDNKNDFGTPTKMIKNSESVNYDTNEHTIVDLDRSLNLWIGKNDQFGIKAPKGYKIIDYDYDKNDTVEFQTITYKNKVPVTKYENAFGTPLRDTLENSDVLDTNEHVVVKVNRKINWLYGKDETKKLTAPDGYKIVDYDYEYGESFQFETYVYSNIVPVKTDNINDFGTATIKK